MDVEVSIVEISVILAAIVVLLIYRFGMVLAAIGLIVCIQPSAASVAAVCLRERIMLILRPSNAMAPGHCWP